MKETAGWYSEQFGDGLIMDFDTREMVGGWALGCTARRGITPVGSLHCTFITESQTWMINMMNSKEEGLEERLVRKFVDEHVEPNQEVNTTLVSEEERALLKSSAIEASRTRTRVEVSDEDVLIKLKMVGLLRKYGIYIDGVSLIPTSRLITIHGKKVKL